MPNHVTNILHFSGEQKEIDRLMHYVQVKNEAYGSFDFNKVIPMPDSLNVESGGSQYDALDVYFSAINPDNEDMGVEKVSKETFDKYLKMAMTGRRFAFREINAKLTYEKVCELSKVFFKEADSGHRDYYVIKDDIFLLGKTVFENIREYGCADWYSWSCDKWGTKWNAYDYVEQDPGSCEIRFNTAWSAPHPVIQKLSRMFPLVGIHHEWADEDFGNNCGYVDYFAGEGEPHYKDNDKDHYKFAAEVLGYDEDEYCETKDGAIWWLYDFPNTVSKELVDKWFEKGFTFYGFKNKISFNEPSGEYNLTGLDAGDIKKFIRRLENHKISIETFFYGE